MPLLLARSHEGAPLPKLYPDRAGYNEILIAIPTSGYLRLYR